MGDLFGKGIFGVGGPVAFTSGFMHTIILTPTPVFCFPLLSLSLRIPFGKSFGYLGNMNEKVAFATSFDDLAAICSDRLMDPAWKIREYLAGVGKKAAYDKKLVGRQALELIASAKKKDIMAQERISCNCF